MARAPLELPAANAANSTKTNLATSRSEVTVDAHLRAPSREGVPQPRRLVVGPSAVAAAGFPCPRGEAVRRAAGPAERSL